MKNVENKFKNIFRKVEKEAGKIYREATDQKTFQDEVDDFFQDAKKECESAWSKVKNVTSEDIVNFFEEVKNFIKDGGKEAVEAMKKLVQSVKDFLIEKHPENSHAIKHSFEKHQREIFSPELQK